MDASGSTNRNQQTQRTHLFDMKKWTLALAVDFCRTVEAICPVYGCHVALTGGCLYKEGERKDLDLVFYRIRQTTINVVGLRYALEKELGVTFSPTNGWCLKAQWEGRNIDMFFPEEPDGARYGEEGDKP